MEQIECSETSAYKIQTPGNYPEESIQQAIPFSDFSKWKAGTGDGKKKINK
jgi:hypothetical protein